MRVAAPRTERFGWWGLSCLGGLMLSLATPPAPLPGFEWLVLPGLMVWFVLATASPRPLRHAYVLGCVHMACFSWSVRHVLLPAYAGIVFVGGLYYLLAAWATTRCRRGTGLGFAVAVAATFWLRAWMPQIHYPHGQPCHCLWTTPTLLGSVTVGGEALANGLLAAIAAALVGVWRSWRVAAPRWRSAWVVLVSTLAVAAALTAIGVAVHRSVVGEGVLRVAAIEPGFHPIAEFELLPEAQQRSRFHQLFEQRLLEPTRRVLRAPDPAELVLWPESTVHETLPEADVLGDGARFRFPDLRGPRAARLVLGANVELAEGVSPAAFLIDPDNGTVLDYQAKRELCPGGEFLPWLAWLPTPVAGWLRGVFGAALGTLPDCVPGAARAPLTSAGGVPFGILICFDNAFLEPASDQVAAGARLLCVLSNEAWYRGGAEVRQLVAMSVCRVLETATPMVRCTQDGWSIALAADGHILAQLPVAPAPQPAARILRLDVPLGAGRLPPLAWLRASLGPFLGVWLALLFLHRLARWARLRVAPTATPAAGGPGSSSAARGSGS